MTFLQERVGWAQLVVLGPAMVVPLAFGFVGLSLTEKAIVFAAGFLAWPFTVLLHELAHGLTAVAVTGKPVDIQVGPEPPLVRFSLGRLHVRWAFGDAGGSCEHAATDSRAAFVAIALSGPLVSGLLAASLLLLALDAEGLAACIAGASAGLAFVGFLQIVPFRDADLWPGADIDEGVSDGLAALRVLREPTGLFGAQAAEVIRRAAHEAAQLGLGVVGTEHLLLALAYDWDGGAARLLREAGVDAGRVRREATAHAPHYTAAPVRPGERPAFTPRVKSVLGRAPHAMGATGGRLIEPRHLLLALSEESEGAAAEIMRRFGVSADDLRTRVVAATSGQ